MWADAISNGQPEAVAELLEEARADVDELLSRGSMSRAVELISHTGVDFDPSYFPMYFTGGFAAHVVLVHLNPKLQDRLSGPRFADFESYVDGHQRFGFHHWGRDPNYRSAFDHKQVRFLRPFDVIEFLAGADADTKRRNAAMVIDRKLQLELVPYASPTFPTQRFTADILRPHFDRVLGVIAAYQRRYVLFCGAVFDELLDRSGLVLAKRDHRFRLPTSRGTSASEYRFSNVVVDYLGVPVHAGVARSFAIQGIPTAEYGRMCRTLYHRDEESVVD